MPTDDTLSTVTMTTLARAETAAPQLESPSDDGDENQLADIAAHLLGDDKNAEP